MAKNRTSIIEKLNPQFEFFEAVMLGYLAFKYMQLWISPAPDQAELIYQFAGLMAFEFIMVHSGVFMAVMPKWISLLVFVPLYGLFAWGFNSMIGGDIVLYVYLLAVLNRMRFAFFNVDQNLKKMQMGKSVMAVMIYFFTALVVAFGHSLVPEFGLNDENLMRIGYEQVKNGGGIFVDEPQTAICLGFVYYSLLCFISLGYTGVFRIFKKEKK